MSPITIYGGCVLLAIAIGGAVARGGRALYAQLDELHGYSKGRDIWTRAGIMVGASLLAAAAGAAYGWRADAMANDPVVGALWGLAGGACSGLLFGDLLGAARRVLGRAADAAVPGGDQ